MTVDITILHADALDIGPDLLEAFDALIVDPPYSTHVHENMASVGGVAPGAMGAHARDPGFDALTPELRAHIALAAAAVKRWSVIFSDHESTHEWRAECDAAGAEFIRMIPWVRWTQPQLSGDRPPSGSEAILLFHAQDVRARGGRTPTRKRWNGPGSRTHYARRCMRGKDKHPTEKPIDLMLDLVSDYTDPGEAVIDLCGGAHTTALACRILGRHCVSVDNAERWIGPGERRVTRPLSGRDEERTKEWIVTTIEEAGTVPTPRAPDGSDVRTWERAQRRIADTNRAIAFLEGRAAA